MVQFSSANAIYYFCLCFKATGIKFTPDNMPACVFNIPLIIVLVKRVAVSQQMSTFTPQQGGEGSGARLIPAS